MKNKTVRVFVGVSSTLALIGLTACSSALTKRDCEETNYYEIGLADGKAGRSADRLTQVTQECSKFGIEAAAPQYGYGRQAGLKDFCSESNARKDATEGRSGSICWQEPFPTYQAAYRNALAKREIDKRKDLGDSKANQAAAQQESDALDTELKQIEAQKAAH